MGRNQLSLEGSALEATKGIGDGVPEESMAELMGRLNLTAEECKVLRVADDVEDGLATSDCAIIGKVLSKNVLHIQTILSALRPGWGNPRGLTMRTVGDNLFIAEFGSKQDKARILDGSPWSVGNRAVLIQEFDASMRRTDICFNQMSIWVRINNLPFEWMNEQWGRKIAEMIGSVEKVDVDAQRRAWGPYLRAKVKIDITKPLRRGVALFSAKRKRTEWYEIRYEKVPNYCYSCGIIGHSSIEFPTPAVCDAEGMLPYGKDLRVSDDRKKKNPDEYIQSSISVGQGNNNAVQRDTMARKPDVRTAEIREKSDNLSDQQGKKRKLLKNPRHETSDASSEEFLEEEDHMSLVLTVARPLGASNPNNPTNAAGPEFKGDDGELEKGEWEYFDEAAAETILNIPLCYTSCDDFPAWKHTKTGVYTVKSGYCLIRLENFHSSQSTNGKGEKSDQADTSKMWKKL
ncbi:hypothetical protein C2845_PM09G10010 [Panicum miliaceum]|uniref:DUF4283 domain-containing protein n=1 Tax=Panicum miliaceum TaxID=4540 RepID=A0A3L6RZW0_PANMI|nr:hypothetical protein C2845_PM09G10010 [Panicum miliaceum]